MQIRTQLSSSTFDIIEKDTITSKYKKNYCNQFVACYVGFMEVGHENDKMRSHEWSS